MNTRDVTVLSMRLVQRVLITTASLTNVPRNGIFSYYAIREALNEQSHSQGAPAISGEEKPRK